MSGIERSLFDHSGSLGVCVCVHSWAKESPKPFGGTKLSSPDLAMFPCYGGTEALAILNAEHKTSPLRFGWQRGHVPYQIAEICNYYNSCSRVGCGKRGCKRRREGHSMFIKARGLDSADFVATFGRENRETPQRNWELRRNARLANVELL